VSLGLPARFLAVHGNQRRILTNLRRPVLRIAIKEPLNIGEAEFLRCGPIDHFMTVLRKRQCSKAKDCEQQIKIGRPEAIPISGNAIGLA